MKYITGLLIIIVILFSSQTSGQKPVWTGEGRIVISSDGNEHDHDDWAATPLSLALLAAKGLQNKLVLYTYSDHIWGSAWDHPTSKSGLNAYEQMQESAVTGGEMFGFNQTNFICAVDNPEIAYQAMVEEINNSSAKDPLIIIAAGPMQVVGEAIHRSNKKKRKYITVISHSTWNNRHADHPSNKNENHNGWTFEEMKHAFENKQGGGVNFIQILDQNGPKDNSFRGFRCEREAFDWIKTSEARTNSLYKPQAWDWLYTRLETCIKNKGTQFDPSDAGMIVYLLTGIEKTDPLMAKNIMENPQPKINE